MGKNFPPLFYHEMLKRIISISAYFYLGQPRSMPIQINTDQWAIMIKFALMLFLKWPQTLGSSHGSTHSWNLVSGATRTQTAGSIA